MDLVLAWALFPALLVVTALGLALIVERVTGFAIPGLLLLPVGTALLVVISQVVTVTGPTAPLTTPVLLLAGLLGLSLSLSRLRGLRPDPWMAIAGIAVFGVFAAPVLLSGEPTVAGYTVLGDTTVHLIGADYILREGQDYGGLAPSTYEYVLAGYFGTGYPSGTQTALGAVQNLISLDVAWVYHPFLAWLAAMLALCLGALAATLVRSRAQLAVVVLLAAQPALVYAYVLQGSIKEIGTAWAITLVAALLPVYVAEKSRPAAARVTPLAIAVAAAFGVLGPTSVLWVGPLMAIALAFAIVKPQRDWARTAREAAAFLLVTAVLSLATLLGLGEAVRAAEGVGTTTIDPGNLLGPLKAVQAFGVWLTGDYRTPPTGTRLTISHVLVVVAVVSGVIGLVWATARRAWPVLAYVGVAVLAWGVITARGGPWADAKALMIVSPAVALATVLGALAVLQRTRLGGTVLVAAIALGFLWSNALAYHDVSLAPRDRLRALEELGPELSRASAPLEYADYEEYSKYYLRKAQPEGSTEGLQRRFAESRLRSGVFARQGFSADLDGFRPRYLLHYRTIFLRRSPNQSRPPAPYQLTRLTSDYEVWKRPADASRVVAVHLPLGQGLSAGARPPCEDVRSLARTARSLRGVLAYSPRDENFVVQPAVGALPGAWFVDPTEANMVRQIGPGRLERAIRVPTSGKYELFMLGSIGRRVTVRVNGRVVKSLKNRLNYRGQYERLGPVNLPAGRSTVSVEAGGGNLEPGNGGINRLIGPLVFTKDPTSSATVRTVPPGAAVRRLCGSRLDWIEVLKSDQSLRKRTRLDAAASNGG